ncbi:hypothetical protein EI94DRAFT_1759418 [Lactarius quietus]|nr:hypothetical protein EI94DRAFT_1759418 [Lactarius quietus]
MVRGTFSTLFEGSFFAGLLIWDLSLVLVNLVTFKRRIGSVTPKGRPVPPSGSGDSRCSCPALNAMANHGLTGGIRSTYNFSPSFCLFVPRYIAHVLDRSYSTGRLDLADIDVHNGIEHDASLVLGHRPTEQGGCQCVARLATTSPIQRIPLFRRVEKVAKETVDLDLNRTLTVADLTRRLGQRRREAKATNRQYSQDTGHKMFGSTKYVVIISSHASLSCSQSLFSGSTLLTVFGGRLDDIYTFLTEERFPEGWESRIRDQMGLTLLTFNRTVFRVELGIDEEVHQPMNLM